MATVLTPQFGPLQFAAECALPGEKLFASATASGGRMLIAGGPQALGLFTVDDTSSALKTFRTKLGQGIAGFCVSDSVLYIHDGPVISAWFLVTQKCFAAQNLSTGQNWDADGAKAGELEPPDSFYTFSEEDQVLYAKLLQARNKRVLAASLADLDQQGTTESKELAGGVRKLLQVDSKDAAAVLAAASTELQQTASAVARIVYSAPVARVHQASGSGGSQVFTLGLNGTVYAMDAKLGSVQPVIRDASPPLRAALALAEPLQTSGNYGCRLYYVTEDGGICVLNGITPNLDALPGWRGVGRPVRDKVLPLSCHGSVLMGGGILGADFFVTGMEATTALAQIVAAPAGGWSSYLVEPKSELVLVSNGTASRLHAYGATAKKRDRWRLRENGAPVHAAFAYTGKGAGSGPGAASEDYLVVIETDVLKPAVGAPGFRILLANTLDCEEPAKNPEYPPPAVELGRGSFGPWNGSPSFSIDWIRHNPSIAGSHMYCVVRATRPASLKADSPQLLTGREPGYAAQLRQLCSGGLLTNSSLPVLRAEGGAPDYVAAFALYAELSAMRPRAKDELAIMAVRAKSVKVRVMLSWTESGLGINPRTENFGPSPVCSTQLSMSLSPGGEIKMTTDAEGIAYFDATRKGSLVTLVPGSYDGLKPHRSGTSRRPDFDFPLPDTGGSRIVIDKPTYHRSVSTVKLDEYNIVELHVRVLVQTKRP